GTSLVGSDGASIDGLDLIDAVTTRASKRLVGEVAVRDDALGTGWIVGFENHRGVTAIGAGAVPLGTRAPERGCANDGVVGARSTATSPPGPGPARNPRLGDPVLESVGAPLTPRADPQAELLHQERLDDVNGARASSRWARRRPARTPRRPPP